MRQQFYGNDGGHSVDFDLSREDSLLLDGKPLKGLRRIDITSELDNIAVVTLEFYPSSVKFNGEIEVSIDE